VILIKFIDVRHRLQSGRSTGQSKTSVSEKGMLRPDHQEIACEMVTAEK
jgi:hypothetical protein